MAKSRRPEPARGECFYRMHTAARQSTARPRVYRTRRPSDESLHRRGKCSFLHRKCSWTSFVVLLARRLACVCRSSSLCCSWHGSLLWVLDGRPCACLAAVSFDVRACIQGYQFNIQPLSADCHPQVETVVVTIALATLVCRCLRLPFTRALLAAALFENRVRWTPRSRKPMRPRKAKDESSCCAPCRKTAERGGARACKAKRRNGR